jgi:hypothetical protein
VAGKVDEDDTIVVRDGRQLEAPVIGTRAEAVEKEERRRLAIGPAATLVVDVRLPAGPGPRRSAPWLLPSVAHE